MEFEKELNELQSGFKVEERAFIRIGFEHAMGLEARRTTSDNSEYVSPTAKSCQNCKYKTTLSDHCHGCMKYYYSKWVKA